MRERGRGGGVVISQNYWKDQNLNIFTSFHLSKLVLSF